LLEGVPLNEDPTPVSYKECGFGSWMYSDEVQLRNLMGSKSFEEIQQQHILRHSEYQKIYQIYCIEAKKGLLAKFAGVRAKVDSLQQDRAKAYFSDLQRMTCDLLQKLSALEQRFKSMPEGYFVKK